MLACRWDVPAILLIRAPLDAVASSTVYLQHDDPRPFLKFYCLFHDCLLPLKDQMAISDFDETISNFGGVMARVNSRYGRQFDLYEESPENRRRVEELIHREHETRMGADAGTLPLPSDEKARRKEAVVDRISDEHHPLAGRAKDVGSAAVFLAISNATIVWAIILLT